MGDRAVADVWGDRSLLRIAVVNLIGNAIKYTQRRSAARIEIGADPSTDGEAIVFVKDNGAGFDMQYASKLFIVFQRLHTADHFEGTGIGLANVQRIVHRHGPGVGDRRGRCRGQGAHRGAEGSVRAVMARGGVPLFAARTPAPRANHRRRQQHRPCVPERIGETLLQGLEAELLRGGDAVLGDGAGQAAHDAGEQRGAGWIAGLQIILQAEAGHLLEPGLLEDRPEPGADRRRRAGGTKRLHDPLAPLPNQADRWLGAHPANVEVDRDELPAGDKVLKMMANGGDRVGEVKQHEPAHHRVERFIRLPAVNVPLDKRHMTLGCGLGPLTRNSERRRGSIEAHDPARRADQLSRQSRHVTEPRPEIEDALPRSDSRGIEKQPSRRLDRGRLAVQSGELRLIAAEHVDLFAARGRFVRP